MFVSPFELFRKILRFPARMRSAEARIVQIEMRNEVLQVQNKELADKYADIYKCNNELYTINNSLRDRLQTLEAQREYLYYSAIPESRYPEELKKWYYRQTGKRLDLDNPKTYNEKIQWFKLYGYTEETTRLVDKYMVREYIASRIGEQYLIPLLGVWKYPEQIDFDALPNQFVLKANHGSGFNFIVHDKNALDRNEIIAKANQWIEKDFSFIVGFEMQYHLVPRRIIAEQYLDSLDGYEYKIWCFMGKAQYIRVMAEKDGDHTGDYFDKEWNLLDFNSNFDNNEVLPPRPSNLEEMIHISETLAENFSHVRVDLYRLASGKLYFSEMTFTPASGVNKWNPPETDLMIGQMFDYTTDYTIH